MLRCLIVAAAASAASAAAPDCAAHPLLSPGACCNATAPATFDITFATTIGPFTVHVERKDAPIGADRLYNLAARHAFDSTGEGDNNAGFFRVVPNFVIQWGIPGNTSVSAAWESAVIANDPVVLSNVRGTLAYAAESDAQGQAYGRTTQLYINFGDNSRLDKIGFTPIGTVSEADMAAVVDKLYAAYGEQPDQDAITAQGDVYLRTNFPRLDYIIGTTVTAAQA